MSDRVILVILIIGVLTFWGFVHVVNAADIYIDPSCATNGDGSFNALDCEHFRTFTVLVTS